MALINTWQSNWKRLLDMAYYRKDISESLVFDDLWVYDKDFELITFEYTWSTYSGEPQVVPELKRLRAPAALFDSLGTRTFMKMCFPNCELIFYEDESQV